MALLFRTELDGEDCVIANVLECVSVLMRPESVILLVRCELLLGLSVPIAMFGTRVTVSVLRASGYGLLWPMIFCTNAGAFTRRAAASPGKVRVSMGTAVRL